jgi:type II secretory pathway predicted ATPase ExeA
MKDKKLLAMYGLKWNPFLPNIPVEALWPPPEIDNFLFRVENLVMDGGFALICGEPGLGKSKDLQMLEHRLKSIGDVVVGVMERPQSSLSDFYREMGTLFGVNLSPANRYGGFKALRERWKSHINNTLFRPVLLVDEAQEMLTPCLNEIRLLGSDKFDSKCLLTSVLWLPHGRDELLNYLEHAISQAGASHLMTQTLMETLVDHAAGNLRVLNSMAAEMLLEGERKEMAKLDEKLFLEMFSRNPGSRKRKGH